MIEFLQGFLLVFLAEALTTLILIRKREERAKNFVDRNINAVNAVLTRSIIRSRSFNQRDLIMRIQEVFFVGVVQPRYWNTPTDWVRSARVLKIIMGILRTAK